MKGEGKDKGTEGWPTCKYEFRPNAFKNSFKYANNAICLGLATSNDCKCRHNK